jgi:ADP-ribose pyrophosphatase YjhB (NUDIX family)
MMQWSTGVDICTVTPEETPIERFIIRVYGIWKRNGAVLLMREGTEEWRFTKFPGGGLKPGEGTADCLRREFREELNIELKALEIFYINDGFVRSAFNPADQLLSVYYLVQSDEEPDFTARTVEKWGKPYHLEPFWLPLEDLNPERLSFPVDKVVVERSRNLLETALLGG